MMAKMEWDFLNFKPEEFACSHSGEQKMDYEFVKKLQKLRSACNFPFIISSAYRSSEHPIEKNKKTPGIHTLGLAVDILCSHKKAFKIVTLASSFGFTGIGVSQSGDNRFVHLDTYEGNEKRPRPHIWSY